MKCPSKILVLSVFLVWKNLSFAQDTFSIVAIDTANRQVGSAAASFVGDATRDLLSQVFYILPGVGAIHTQAWYLEGNYLNARRWMSEGKSPQAIIDSVLANDAGHSPQIRQYIAIDLVNGGRTAGYTGSGCDDYKNHVLGKDYAIAGNDLYGQAVLDSMEAGFLRTTGTLADRLMAALMGGKSAGGDKRGSQYHLSSLFAALKVANPGNKDDSLYLDLLVSNPSFLPGGGGPKKDPVDVLQARYKTWKLQHVNVVIDDFQKQDYDYRLYQNYPNPFNPSTTIHFSLVQRQRVSLKVYDMSGNEVASLIRNERKEAGDYRTEFHAGHLASGVYVYRLRAEDFTQTRKMVIIK